MKTLTAFLVVALAIAGYWYFKPDNVAIHVETTSPTIEEISLALEETGRVVNDRIVKLTSLVNGKIVETRFNVGDHVDADEIVAIYDTKEIDALREKTFAEIERDQLAIDHMRLMLDRQEELKKSSSSSQQKLDQARYDLNAAEATLTLTRSNLRIYDIKKEQSVLRSPYSGVVIEKISEAGQWMEAGTLLYTLVADEGFEIEIKIDSSELANIHTNMLADAYLEDQPETRWQAPVHWISPSIGSTDDEKDNNFAVRLPITDSAPQLLLNQQIQISIPLKTASDTMVLPTNALLATEDTDEVAVVVDGKIQLVTLTLGIETVNKVQVLSGLDEDAVVVIPNGQTLSSGQFVNIDNET